MEKNSAACAMEWSVELDKALRSRNPGRCVEAIHRIGARLERWGREPEPTMASSRMLDLISGEDRLFANTILLRLADAFRFGDMSVRLAVVKVFRSGLRNCNGKGRKWNCGVLGKGRVQNQAELLKRVKVVFDTGDAESRALALVLFGCWAGFAKDSAQIRYLILSTLVSSDDSEVKASLFAAGCFCKLSDDFALVVLEMLVNLVTSCEISLAVRLTGVRIFAKMRSSFSIANRAYKAGLKLALDASEEDLLVVLLVSLSKLASKLSVLIPNQVELLLSFLSQERTLRMRETAIRSIHFLLIQGVVYVPNRGHFISTLINTFNDPELSIALQCQVLQILHRILLYELRNLPCTETLEFTNLLTTIKNASQISSKSLSAIRVMADISSKLMNRPEMLSDSICSSFQPMQLISLIIEQMTLSVKPLPDLDHTRYVQSLFFLLLFLVTQHPDLGTFVLDKVDSFVKYIVHLRQEGLSVSDIEKSGGEKSLIIIIPKLISHVHKFLGACLENLDEVGGITTQVLDKTKTLVSCVHESILLDGYAKTIFAILLHSRMIWGFIVNGSKENYDLDQKSAKSLQDPVIEQELISLKFAKTLIENEDYWYAYRAGTYAACQGSWVTATFILTQLTSKAQSNYCCFWLNSLAQLARSESKIQLFLLPKERYISVDSIEIVKTSDMDLAGDFNEINQDRTGNMNILVGAYNGIRSSGESLDSSATSAFCFQKWFLGLRAKVLGTVVEILKICGQDMITLQSLKSLQQISFRLKRMACEYDLIAISFIGMDGRSSRVISALALSCSLLAFSTGFSLFIPNLPACESIELCGPVLLHDLMGRLRKVDCETSRNVSMLLEVSGEFENCLHLHSRNLSMDIGCEARHVQTICEHAISSVVLMQNEGSLVQSENLQSKITKDGVEFLSDIVMKWIRIPFRIPKYFLKVRSCIGSELFASSTETSYSNEILVHPRSHLSLNLCLRVQNLPSNLPVRLAEVYCILSCRPNEGSKEQEQDPYKPWETEDLVEMDEKLLRYVTERSKKSNGKRRRSSGKDQGVVNAFTCFELDERGQGFSNCLLDVSDFPQGCYRIRWHSCCVDDQSSYWSLLPLNTGPVFTIRGSLKDQLILQY